MHISWNLKGMPQCEKLQKVSEVCWKDSHLMIVENGTFLSNCFFSFKWVMNEYYIYSINIVSCFFNFDRTNREHVLRYTRDTRFQKYSLVLKSILLSLSIYLKEWIQLFEISHLYVFNIYPFGVLVWTLEKMQKHQVS